MMWDIRISTARRPDSQSEVLADGCQVRHFRSINIIKAVGKLSWDLDTQLARHP